MDKINHEIVEPGTYRWTWCTDCLCNHWMKEVGRSVSCLGEHFDPRHPGPDQYLQYGRGPRVVEVCSRQPEKYPKWMDDFIRPKHYKDEDYQGSTYTQEYDTFSDADPGL